MKMNIINLDHISANPLLPEVQDAIMDAVRMNYGNPSSQHKIGDQAAEALSKARESVAGLINAPNPKEVVFTSGGTESVNLAVKGVAFANAAKGKHIVTSNIEHNAVLRSLRRLKMMDYKVTSVPVDEYGRVNPDHVAKAIKDETILVSIMHSNNEIGTIQPIKEIAHITKDKKVLFHTDAVDSVGVVPIDVQGLGVDLLSFASNTFYGPTGVGGLYVRSGTKLWPLLDGGVQENNKRAGAENLIGIIGMGVAADLAERNMDARIDHVGRLRAKLLEELPDYIDEYYLNGHPEYSLPNLVSVSIKYVEGESVVLMLDEENIAVSTRSACAAGALQASHVLLSIGRDFADAQGTMVVTFGAENAEKDVSRFLSVLKGAVKTLREISPLYNRDEDRRLKAGEG
jgi:cysteine desulfurase